MTMADKIVILRLGKVEQVGRPLDLYNAPANRFVAGFIGSPRMNFLEGHISTIGNGVTVAIEGAPEIRVACRGDGCRPGDPVTLGIRPEHIRRADGHGLHASVKADEQLGSDSYLYCTLPGGQALTIHAPGQTPERRGDTIAIAFPPGLCHLFHQQGDDEPALPRSDRTADETR
jgi:ABC-type sugar transport system ATPase subunit